MSILKKSTFAVLSALFLCGCTNKTTIASAYYSYDTQCLGIELDGSQTLLAWGDGRNLADAKEQAKKNAVRDVIFKGIHEGKSDCNQRAIINEPNARDKYERYFNIFFADGGEYKKYVSMIDEKKGSRNKENYQYGKKVSVTVRVLRDQLKERFIRDGILKK